MMGADGKVHSQKWHYTRKPNQEAKDEAAYDATVEEKWVTLPAYI